MLTARWATVLFWAVLCLKTAYQENRDVGYLNSSLFFLLHFLFVFFMKFVHNLLYSAVELYKDQPYDLLAKRKKLRIRENKITGPFVDGLQELVG